MLQLLLLRHAKSSWDEPDRPDHDRELTPRGRKAAARIGRLLAREGLVPDQAICSTAARAAATWELVARELPGPVPVRHLKSLYLAAPARLLDHIRRQEPDTRRLLLVGHNPGLHSLALRLAGKKGEPVLRARLAEKLPTGGLVLLEVDADSWAAVEPAHALLRGCWRPRELE